ncbi:MAG: S9 family peptidase [Phycisphaerales bacterium]|nr:S9 family peptidase [Phycisphaerales bacterium]
MKIWFAAVLSATLVLSAAAVAQPGTHPSAGAKEVSLIPRAVLFGNPERRGGNLSHDGNWVSWIAPDAKGVMNVFVAPRAHPDQARQVTRDASRGIRTYTWAYDNAHVLYLQDQGGDENYKLYAVNVHHADQPARDLTPIESINGPDGKPITLPTGKPMRPTAQIQGLSDRFPGKVAVGLNCRNPEYHDLFVLEIATGKMEPLLQNDGFAEFVIDDDFNVRLAGKANEKGGMDWSKNTGGHGETPKWEAFMSVPMEDALTTAPRGFDKSGRTLYLTDGRKSDTAALVEMDWETGKTRVLAQDPRADVGAVLADPRTGKVQAVAVEYDRQSWKVLDASIQPDLDYLKTVTDGELMVQARSDDDRTWMVGFGVDTGAPRAYLYDRDAKKATLLYSTNSRLDGRPLVKMKPVIIKSRDGMDLVSYLTLPPGSDPDGDGVPDHPVPMVLNVHGGPWARDSWGYNPTAQWLSNRGYACLAVNFRSSTGFGKRFINAGNLQWAGTMHDDLIDAVNWAVEHKVAQKDKVAIMGGSYGGYATLVGLTFTPDVFACGVDIVGPSNLNTLLKSIPPYWAPMLETMARQVGDPRTEEGKKLLESRSPLTRVEAITKPLLIGQGYNDPRVKFMEAEQIVSAMERKGLLVTYVLYPDEGHGFQRPQNRLSFYAVAEAFLAKHLGGRAEPIGDDFKGSSIKVPTGAEGVPGVKAALGAAKTDK